MLGLDARAPAAPPSFWSDQHGMRIQYLGHAHGADGIAIDGDPAPRDFTATFTRDGRPSPRCSSDAPTPSPELRRQIDAAATRPPERTAA